MSPDQITSDIFYRVVVNDEDQYSIWFVDQDLPPGWSEVGKSGTREDCLAFVEEAWTDMTPRSLRPKAGGA